MDRLFMRYGCTMYCCTYSKKYSVALAIMHHLFFGSATMYHSLPGEFQVISYARVARQMLTLRVRRAHASFFIHNDNEEF